MNTIVATNDQKIAFLPLSIVTLPSVGLMISSLIGSLLNWIGSLPSRNTETMLSTSFSVIERPLIVPRLEIVLSMLGAVISRLSSTMPK